MTPAKPLLTAVPLAALTPRIRSGSDLAADRGRGNGGFDVPDSGETDFEIGNGGDVFMVLLQVDASTAAAPIVTNKMAPPINRT